MTGAERGVRWQVARVERIIDENHHVKTFTLRLPSWQPFRPGQHVDVRVASLDGDRSRYPIASPPEQKDTIDLTIERGDGGAASPYFHDALWLGEEVEVRGPMGGSFSWTVHDGGPLLLIAGGAGIVPLMSMLRHRAARRSDVVAVLLYSSRAPQDLIYGDELCPGNDSPLRLPVIHTFTRHPPPRWTGYRERIHSKMLEAALDQTGSVAHAFVCGSSPFVEHVARLLVALGVTPDLVRTERVGSDEMEGGSR